MKRFKKTQKAIQEKGWNLEHLMIEGYRKMSEEDKVINQEWEDVTLENE